MGIIAHERAQPLATMPADRRSPAHEAPQHGEGAERLYDLSLRLNHLVRNMNHQIDMQITNARLMRLGGHTERISASALVHDAIAEYPFRSSRERSAVVVRVHEDFEFLGTPGLFRQVVDNLTKNALRSLAAATSATQPGDLLIQVGAHGGRGRIVFTDNGVGMDAELQLRIFQPFFSRPGHRPGLGLAFFTCGAAAHGTIRASRSPPGRDLHDRTAVT